MSDALVRCYLILYWVLPLPVNVSQGPDIDYRGDYRE